MHRKNDSDAGNGECAKKENKHDGYRKHSFEIFFRRKHSVGNGEDEIDNGYSKKLIWRVG
jgi:hypothetical protein